MANIFSDDFNRADGGLGANWTTRHTGVWGIVSNRAACTTGSSVTIAHYNGSVSTADYTVQSIINCGTGNIGGICGRRIDYGANDSNYYRADIRNAANTLRLYKKVGATLTQLAQSGALTINDSTDYTLKLHMEGTTIKAFLDAAEILSVTDSDLSAAGDGGLVYGGTDTLIRWDDFTIDDLGGGAPTDQTITTKGRISALADKTQTSKGRISKAVDQTLAALARIAKVIDGTIDAKARLSKAADATVNAVGRLSKAADQTVASLARVSKAADQTLTALANIIVSGLTDKTITALANIRNTADRVLTAAARLAKTLDQAIASKARLARLADQSITGLGRLLKTVDQTIGSKASISDGSTPTHPDAFRVQLPTNPIGKIVMNSGIPKIQSYSRTGKVVK